MEMISIPTYQDFFDDKVPDLNLLLETIPSNAVIFLLAHFDAQLLHNDSVNTQKTLLYHLIRRQPTYLFNNLATKIYPFFHDKENKTVIFGRPYIKSFLHYELTHYRDLPEIEDLTPEQELNIFKAYLIIATIKSNELFNISFREAQIGDGDFFPTHTWPMIITQYDVNTTNGLMSNLIKEICLLNYLQYHSEYSQYVIKFLSHKEKKNSWEYIIFLMHLIQSSWKARKSDIIPSCIDGNSKNQSLMEHLAVDPAHYLEKYKNKVENYTELKSKPLFKYKSNYHVLDWNFLANKIYDGLIFDFYTDSGISNLSQFNSIPKFKSYVAHQVTEQFIFRSIIRYLLSNKYSVLKFDDDCDNGYPDAYYRKGNDIIFFEIKDSFFPSSVIDSCSHQQIAKAINNKYNNERKGIGQIIKHIRKLQNSSYETSPTYKNRNLNIYPILIYTDKYFGMPGISNYLIDQFNNKINDENLRNTFKKISNLTFIDLNFLIDHSKFLLDYGFIACLDKLHHEIGKRKKKQSKFKNIENLFNYQESLEMIFLTISKLNKHEELDIKALYEKLNMGEGLPNE